jgi:hypothetical protein
MSLQRREVTKQGMGQCANQESDPREGMKCQWDRASPAEACLSMFGLGRERLVLRFGRTISQNYRLPWDLDAGQVIPPGTGRLSHFMLAICPLDWKTIPAVSSRRNKIARGAFMAESTAAKDEEGFSGFGQESCRGNYIGRATRSRINSDRSFFTFPTVCLDSGRMPSAARISDPRLVVA